MGWEVGLTVPGAALKAHRKALGHSQRDAARIIDTHRSVFSRWENSDVAAISTRHAAAVRSYLGRARDASDPQSLTESGTAQLQAEWYEPCTPAACERYDDCVALQRAGLWTLCEVEPPTLPDLLRYERLVRSGALDPQSVHFPTEEATARPEFPTKAEGARLVPAGRDYEIPPLRCAPVGMTADGRRDFSTPCGRSK